MSQAASRPCRVLSAACLTRTGSGGTHKPHALSLHLVAEPRSSDKRLVLHDQALVARQYLLFHVDLAPVSRSNAGLVRSLTAVRQADLGT